MKSTRKKIVLSLLLAFVIIIFSAPIIANLLIAQFESIVFNQIWETIDSDYLYAERDYDYLSNLKAEYATRLSNGLSIIDFYSTLDEMFSLLGDEHSSFSPPSYVATQICKYSMTYGHGMYLMPFSNQLKVIGVWPNSPSAKAGISKNDVIVQINDASPVTEQNKPGCIRPNQAITLSVKKLGDSNITKVILQTDNSSYFLPVDAWLTINDQKTFGYVRVVGFDEVTHVLLDRALKNIFKEPNISGLILDLRVNSGGEIRYLKQSLSYFIEGYQGEFICPRTKFDDNTVTVPTPINKIDLRNLPIVILVGKDTFSAGELFAGILQNSGRAYVIGEQTSGNTEMLSLYRGWEGSSFGLAVCQFESKYPNSSWELSGIIPNEIVENDWENYLIDGKDEIMEAAIRYLNSK